MSLLTDLISEQFTITGKGRWLKTVEHDSLVIDMDRDLFFWNSKKISGDAYMWLTRILGYSATEASKILKTKNFKDTPTITLKVGNEVQKITPHKSLVDIFWKAGKLKRDYWYSRNVSDYTCDRFRLGFYEGWYLIPFFVDGEFVNFQKRRDVPEKMICSWYTGTSPFLFNSDILKHSTAVIITESPTDAILLSQYGYPAVSHNGGASFWNSNWNEKFVQQKEIFIVYDNDEAGILGSKEVANNLGIYRSRIYTFEGKKEKYDLGDWLKENNPQDFGGLLENKARRTYE